ncbi:hypothetical protein [Candidatus Ichthyocystis sparus]|uniref:hypothetical protein n=1 Tax=Candidatus Ichthyocystis sparus TaxID=1561004 RepID=UPI001F5F9E20|nr:hypothetical protein [Candidatus Ichthyocystis sparus]
MVLGTMKNTYMAVPASGMPPQSFVRVRTCDKTSCSDICSDQPLKLNPIDVYPICGVYVAALKVCLNALVLSG